MTILSDETGELSRRSLLKGVAALGLSAPMLGLLGAPSFAAGPVGTKENPLKLAWNAGSACFAAIAVAIKNDLFAKHGLTVEMINYAGSTDQLLETIATGKADAGVGMILRWLKPLEQGFDVKLVAGLHGGCMRLLVPKDSAIKSLEDLKGKRIGTTMLGGADHNFFSFLLGKRGIDPVQDVTWRVYPGDLLELAIEKGEIDALTGYDPLAWSFVKGGKLVELATNLSDEYHDRTCCVLGVRGGLLKENLEAARNLTNALFEAEQIAAHDPAAAAAFAAFTPKYDVKDLADLLGSHAHHNQITGAELRRQVIAYVNELKQVGIFKEGTNAEKFADRFVYDIKAE